MACFQRPPRAIHSREFDLQNQRTAQHTFDSLKCVLYKFDAEKNSGGSIRPLWIFPPNCSYLSLSLFQSSPTDLTLFYNNDCTAAVRELTMVT